MSATSSPNERTQKFGACRRRRIVDAAPSSSITVLISKAYNGVRQQEEPEMAKEIEIAREIDRLFYKRWREKPAESEGPSWEDAKEMFAEIRQLFPDATLEEHERAIQIITFPSAARR